MLYQTHLQQLLLCNRITVGVWICARVGPGGIIYGVNKERSVILKGWFPELISWCLLRCADECVFPTERCISMFVVSHPSNKLHRASRINCRTKEKTCNFPRFLKDCCQCVQEERVLRFPWTGRPTALYSFRDTNHKLFYLIYLENYFVRIEHEMNMQSTFK